MAEGNRTGGAWYEQKETARSDAPLKLTLFLVRLLPHWLLVTFTFPVSFFYWLCCPKARATAALFQKQVCAFKKKKIKVNTYAQFFSFALCLVEKVEGWCGKKKFSSIIYGDDDCAELKKILGQKKGALLIGSHLGNSELLRSFASFGETGVPLRVGVTTIVDTKTTAKFNKMISALNMSEDMEALSTEQIGPGTVDYLQQKIDSGSLVVLMGDRVSSSVPGRSLKNTFLGKEAAFPYGIFLMASLLECPVYYFFALRPKDITFSSKYNMIVKKSKIQFISGRKNRDLNLQNFCKEYVNLLQENCIAHPFQWYNFFDFWA